MGCLRLRTEVRFEESEYGYLWADGNVLYLSILHQCQYPGHDTVLEFYKMLHLGKLNKCCVGGLPITCYNFM